MKQLWPYLQLARPANIITAWADILLGFAASGAVVAFSLGHIDIENWSALFWLLLATTGLYGGGVVMNDVFDADLDAVERPERPIPSGKVTLKGATVWGISLLFLGIVAAAQVSAWSGVLAGLTGFFAVLYDAFGKHHKFLGPLNMGLCRGLNVLLGTSVATLMPQHFWLFFVPIIYISAITTISRGEVSGSNHRELKIGLVLYGLVFAILLWLNYLNGGEWLTQTAFLILFAWIILRPLIKAIRHPLPKNIGKAVKMGVIALIILDASLAVPFAGFWYSLIMLMLLPVSFLLARYFAVT